MSKNSMRDGSELELPGIDLSEFLAEFLALRTIVVALVAFRAVEAEASGGSAQAFINDTAVLCQETIVGSNVSLDGGDEGVLFREAAAKHVVNILSLARFDKRDERAT